MTVSEQNHTCIVCLSVSRNGSVLEPGALRLFTLESSTLEPSILLKKHSSSKLPSCLVTMSTDCSPFENLTMMADASCHHLSTRLVQYSMTSIPALFMVPSLVLLLTSSKIHGCSSMHTKTQTLRVGQLQDSFAREDQTTRYK
jgi:hypothetical protein